MSDESEFQKPRPTRKSTAPSASLRRTLTHASVARDMVNLHLQGRNPLRHQTSASVHARIRPAANGGSAIAHGNGRKSIPSTSKPDLSGLKESSVAFGPRKPINTSAKREQSPGSALKTALRETNFHEPRSGENLAVPLAGEKPVPPFESKAQVHVPATSHCGPCKNSQCGHCGTVMIPSPKAGFPLREQPSISVNDWSIYTTKGPICLSEELDHLNDTRFEFPLPEMIFGNNRVLLVNDKTGALIDFNTLDALDSLAPAADFKVACYKEWLSTRPKAKASDSEGSGDSDDISVAPFSADLARSSGSLSSSTLPKTASNDLPAVSPDLQSVKPYDWTYSTNYRGTLQKCKFTKTAQDIPLEKLVRQDPILFYDESILFEDELGDNGISMLSTRVRVMHSCLLLLCRFSMRVDDVAFRIRDTRIYIDLESNLVLREYKVQQALYAELLGKISGRSSDPKKLLRDSNWVSQTTPIVLREMEVLDDTTSPGVS